AAGLNGFTGSIPSTISTLTALNELQLNFNNISGSIPVSITSLLNLQDLRLSFNNLTGAVPAITSSNLDILDLSHNHLSTLPTSMNTGEIHLSHNDFRGSMPARLSAYVIDLSYNSLSAGLDGLLRTPLTEYNDSVELYFASCNFSGPFPSYSDVPISGLDVSNNSFAGPFPSTLFKQIEWDSPKT
ncbi:unnamed protein product, partial [Closterium sp. Naga37s-1]